jgi:hypothetical protein
MVQTNRSNARKNFSNFFFKKGKKKIEFICFLAKQAVGQKKNNYFHPNFPIFSFLCLAFALSKKLGTKHPLIVRHVQLSLIFLR